MAEKGGKGFSLPKGSLKGKDDNSAAKSKKGMKVQIDFEGVSDPSVPISPKTNGKINSPLPKGGSGKGGKGSKTTNGGKGSATKAPPPPPEFKIEDGLPKNAKCLMDCEAAEILQGIQDRMAALSADPTIKIPISFDRGLEYAKRSGVSSNPLAVRKTLEPLERCGVSDVEMCMIANLKVDTEDEVFALVPSLKGKKDKLREPLKSALSELPKTKGSA